MSTLIKSAIIIAPSSPYHLQQKDLLIENGIIKKIDTNISSKKGDQIITLENLHISSGWFDSSVSFGEPGYEERETIKNGLSVAAKSGFSAVAVNPNTFPVSDTKSAISFFINQAEGFATHLYPIGALTQQSKGKEMAELFDMQQAGAIAFSDYNTPIVNDNLLKIALLYAQNFDGLVCSFPKNTKIAGEGVANEGINSTGLGLKGIPALAEHLQIARDLFLLEYTGGKLHIPTISTQKSVSLIKEAKKKGLDVSCSVSVHHLFLTDDELHDFNANAKVTPPLRTEEDRKALIKGLSDGTIDMITSDHNPIDIEHKKVAFSEAKNGTIGLESAFGALHTILDLETIVEKLTTSPKKRFHLPIHQIKEGEIADLTLFNPAKKYIFNEKDIISTSKNSIFIGKNLQGKTYGIFANNQLIIHK